MRTGVLNSLLRPVREKTPISNYLTPLPPEVPTPWVRPADWPSIAGPATNTIKFLVSDIDLLKYSMSAQVSTGTYSVDWGDGTSDTGIATAATATHTYTLGAGTACSRGYTTWIITVSADTANITRWGLIAIRINDYFNPHGYLDAEFNTPAMSSLLNLFYLSNYADTTPYLEHCNFCSVMPATSCAYTFRGCHSLQSVTGLIFSNALTTCFAMFYDCFSLQFVDLSQIGSNAITEVSNMFWDCYKLRSVDLSKFKAVTAGTSIFYYCVSLEWVTGLDFASGFTDATGMFYYCYSLREVDISKLIGITTATNMFTYCYNLKAIDITKLTSLSTTTSMFSYCASLQSIDVSKNTGITVAGSMFTYCHSLKIIDMTGCNSVNVYSSMFAYCFSLKQVILGSGWTAAVAASSMFTSCYVLTSVDISGMTGITSASNMFQNCYDLLSLDLHNSTDITVLDYVCRDCKNLSSVNITGLTKVTSAISAFNNCNCLTTITGVEDLGSAAASVDATSMFTGVQRRTSIVLTGAKLTKIGTIGVSGKLNLLTALSFHASSTFSNATINQIDVRYCSFSAAQLDTLFASLPGMAKTIGITGTTGAAVASQSSCGTTSGSATVTEANTSTVVVGQEVIGAGISTAVAVTLQGAGDTVTRNGHGIPNGKIVYFLTLVTTTGIAIYAPYYVVNTATNTFQLSLTAGGDPIALTNDGSGTIVYSSIVQSINTNVSFTIDVPASATATVTLVNSIMHPMLAMGRGWTVVN